MTRSGRAPRRPPSLSTFQFSRLCHADPATVARWCDQGKVRCYRTPGGHRRILRSEALAFLERHGMPLPGGRRPARLILVASVDARKIRALRGALPAGWRLAATGDAVDALIRVGAEAPRVVVLDAGAGIDAGEAARRLAGHPAARGLRVAAFVAGRPTARRGGALFLSEDDPPEAWAAALCGGLS